MYSNISDIRQALQTGQISSYLLIPEDFLETGTIELYSLEKKRLCQILNCLPNFQVLLLPPSLKTKWMEMTLNRVLDPVNIKYFNLKRAATLLGEVLLIFLPVLAFQFLQLFFFSSVFFIFWLSASRRCRGKENRIIEILLSSVTPSEILTGKILGLGAVGLLQIGFWLAAVVLRAATPLR